MKNIETRRDHTSVITHLGFLIIFVFSFLFAGAQTVTMKSILTEMRDIGAYPVLKPATIYGMQSSYDRSGKNDDGFAGTYSVLRKENGNAVVAEIKGAGAITRIWFPIDRGYPDVPMGLRNRKIFIYLDGDSTPAVSIPVVDIFNNTSKDFPYPLCGMGLGGCWCYLPIPFSNGAKVVMERDKVLFFHIQYNQYSGKKVESFNLSDNALSVEKEKIMNAFSDPGNLNFLSQQDTIVRRDSYALRKGMNSLTFLKGPAILGGITIQASPDDLINFLDGRIIISWDGGKEPAINVPLSMFFIQEKSGLNSKSLMAGLLAGGGGVYNYFPMPYHREAKVQIEVTKACKIRVTTIFTKPQSADTSLCYLHIKHTKDYPTHPGRRHTWLDITGEGHFAGVYMRVAGPSLVDSTSGFTYWTGCLEGDEVFEVDGQMVEHGTGTEDYFNAGWNGLHGKLDHAQAFAFHGFTLFDAGKDSSRVAAYRWHLPTEVVSFKKHFKASIEAGPIDDIKGNYESIAYYYLTLP